MLVIVLMVADVSANANYSRNANSSDSANASELIVVIVMAVDGCS